MHRPRPCHPPPPPPPPRQPPPPRYPPFGTLSEAEEEALPPGCAVDLDSDALQRLLGFRVGDLGLYQRAFTHFSANSETNYERLEFLGDSVVNFVVARYLFERYPAEQEGFLTKMRTRIVRSETLATFAKALALERFVVMAGKHIYRNWHRSPKIGEDLFEALVGAVYLDQGLQIAKQFILHHVGTLDVADLHKDRNYKDAAMRHCHAKKAPLPIYESALIVENLGDDKYKKYYRCTIRMLGVSGIGTDRIKRTAEQNAARQALVRLGVPLDD